MARATPRYPVYVISKGRFAYADALTARFLTSDRCPFSLVVEPQEEAAYRETFPDAEILVLPFSNLGQGGIPARNWVWEHARAAGHARHWILDDNIRDIRRAYKGRRIPCDAGPAFAVVEDFTDRYENVAISGMNYQMFVIPGGRPFAKNVHVYSCLLIKNDLPYRWRGRYNEDTDLCLQVLSGGFCTLQVSVFMVDKMPTMTMKGGNSAELYEGDGRLKMARSLERAWPYVVRVDRRFKRPQHNRRSDVFCKAEYSEGRLSFGGVIGPRASGNCDGGAGQIDMEFAHRNPADDDDRYSHPISPEEIEFAAPWDADLWFDFLDAWKNWHLNEMRPYCEHQAALGWRERARKKITLYHWRTTDFVSGRVREAEKEATAALRAGKTVQHPQEILDLIVLPYNVTTGSPEPPSGYYEPNGPRYDGDFYNRASEEKLAGWVRPNQHPDGLLTAPCPVCGYEYGSAWKSEPVPEDVLTFLQGLPTSEKTPAWV